MLAIMKGFYSVFVEQNTAVLLSIVDPVVYDQDSIHRCGTKILFDNQEVEAP